MAVLGLLFGQQRVVIGAKERLKASSFGPLSKILSENLGGLAGIVVDASVNEEHVSEAEVTRNPVEDGTTLVDHVQLMPKRLTIDGVISDAPLGYAVVGNIQNVVGRARDLFGGNARSIDAYNDLLNLQASRTPFTVITSLKRYDNMIMTSLSVPRSSATGRSIHFKATMEEIRIVKSREIRGVNAAASVRDKVQPLKDKGQAVTETVPAPGNINTQANTDGTFLKSASSFFGF